MDETVIQSVVPEAVRRSDLRKLAGYRTLQHPYATHLLETRVRCPHRSGSVGAQGYPKHANLHAHFEPARLGDQETGQRVAATVRNECGDNTTNGFP